MGLGLGLGVGLGVGVGVGVRLVHLVMRDPDGVEAREAEQVGGQRGQPVV